MAGNLNSQIPRRFPHNTATEAQEVNDENTIIAGAKAVSVKNTGAAQGTFDGIAIEPGEVVNYPFVGTNYGAIQYDARPTRFKIFVFR